jgi:hypothetical protein
MGTRIRCYTLFDITKTDITSRRPPLDISTEKLVLWENKRNTQCNLDTIVQVISLRAQPENITSTDKITINLTEFDKFGFLIDPTELCDVHSFDFYVNHSGVFMENENELGALYTDCSGVPMIKIHDRHIRLPDFLDTTPELRNIYFEVLSYE